MAFDSKIEQMISVAETKILRWMSGTTKEDKITNLCIKSSIGVILIVEKNEGDILKQWQYI